MRKASLFSGVGGIDLAAHWAGMETVVFCEREPFPQRVLRKHWPDVPIIDDVHDFNRRRLDELGIGTIDLVSAGYPCQPESHAGKRRGKEDDRWLWPEVRRVLEEIRPRWFVGENVDGHVSMGLDTVLADLGGRTTPRKRSLFQLRLSERVISEIESSLWPSPQARDFRSGDQPDSPRATRKQEQGWSPNLNDVVLWPTPTASQDWKPIRPLAPSEADGTHGTMLVGAVGHEEPQNVGGQLNPEWVEVLMNFPVGWTEA